MGAAGFLSACSSAARIVPGLPGAAQIEPSLFAPHAGGGTMPLQIVNKTAYPDSDIFFYIVGQPQAGPDRPWVHVLDASGKTKDCVASDGKDGIADYSLQLSKIPGGNVRLPSLHGGRMYFSIKDKLKIPIGKGSNPVPGSPPGWVGPDPNYGILFDFWEFTLVADDPKTGFNFNATQVDMFGLPLAIRGIGATENGKPVDATIGFPSGVRSKVFAALRAAAGFERLVIEGRLGDLRAIAPNLGIDPIAGKNGSTPLFSKTYFDPYVDELWAYYTSHPLNAKTSQGMYAGKVDAKGFFAFTQAGKPTIYFRKPTTKEVFECNMQPLCGDSTAPCSLSDLGSIEIKGALPAAINRSSLPMANLGIIPGEPACNTSLKNAYKKTPTNEYSRILHQYAIDGTAYGFGNDDVCAGSSYVAVRKPTRATVTLQAF
jgi:hypothetical protein